jgi:crotonobetainyl-CoA:carnitine CoA-transferase CaiB-like acyl-CoA transferase
MSEDTMTAQQQTEHLPLEQLVVLDLSRVLSGPYCSMMLGDMGATVWKVEPPSGDECRGLAPPYINGESAYYLSINRNKLDICLDLRRPEGREILLKMADRADVLLENFRPDMKERMGIGYGVISQRNPRIVYCSISGFGQDGPYKDMSGLDNIFQGMAGMMQISGEEGSPPMKVGERIADVIAGMQAAFGIMVALHHRSRTQVGQFLDLSLVDSLISTQAPLISYYFATGQQPPKRGNGSIFSAPTQMFPTADRPINLCIMLDKHWTKLCHALGLEGALHDPRFQNNPLRVKNADAVNEIVARGLRTKPSSHWMEVFTQAGIPCGYVYNYDEVFHDPQVLHNGMLQEIDHPTVGKHKTIGLPIRLHGSPGKIRRPSPLLGQHSREILAELGYRGEEIDSLIRNGIVKQADLSKR